MNYEQATQKLLETPWKVTTCSQGEQCWCRIIIPENPIAFDKNDSIDEIITQGSVHKEIAEYIVKLHNTQLDNQIQKMLDATRSAETDTLELPEITEKNTSTVKSQKLPYKSEPSS